MVDEFCLLFIQANQIFQDNKEKINLVYAKSKFHKFDKTEILYDNYYYLH